MTDQTSKTIAALLTCFNRRETTLRALEALFAQQLPASCQLKVYLTDDGSSDGTGDAVRSRFPHVTVVQGDGNLYWVGGMRAAWQAASPADFYLWLNDDVHLFDGALQTLLKTFENQGEPATIVVGATCDGATGKTNTGGLWRRSWFDVGVHAPQDRPVSCDSLDGNLVLVPRAAEELLGMLSDKYVHYFGDADYGLRARKAGIPILLAPGHLATCKPNSRKRSVYDHEISLRDRWRCMVQPKGYRPPRPWWNFIQTHAPHPKLFYFAAPYAVFLAEHLLKGRWQIRRNVRRPADEPLTPSKAS
jgi:GT2 family glycosyltransferase